MSRRKRAPFVALTTLLRRRFPDVDEPEELIARGLVLVDGAPTFNPRTRVRADAAIRILRPRPLRGAVKLAYALDAFGVDASGLVAVDLGAATGGFTQTLLDAGAARVYAVDAGVGQLRGSLRADPRVINLEKTNLGELNCRLVPDAVQLLTMDLSYLAVSDAVPQLDRLCLAPGTALVAMVKPTYELHAATLAARPEEVDDAAATAAEALVREGWEVLGRRRSPVPGSRGAVETFLHARRIVACGDLSDHES